MNLTELQTAITENQNTVTETLQQVAGDLKTLRDRADHLEARMNRPRAGGGYDGPGEPGGEMKAFTNFIRHGREAMSLDEVKSLQLADDTTGGYLAPPEFVRELLRNIVAFSPIRSLARVVSITAGAALLPKRTGELACQWVGETSARPSTQPAYGLNRYDVKELACFVDCSTQMLDDSAFDIAAELAYDFGEQFGKTEGAAFISGSAPTEPFGILNDPDVGYTPSGNASAITADGLIDVFHALPAAYRANGTWGANATTLSAIRRLKDGTGNYLVLTAGLAGQVTTTLLGRPIVEMPDLPDVAAGTYPVLFGDFQAGFRIFDRVQLAVLRDPYSQATSGLTRFHARRRLAAGVAKAEALRKLKVATS